MTLAQAIIDTQALAHNLQQARIAAPHSRLMAVIKADGYGHGLRAVAKALPSADGLAVARLEEAIYLRQQGITQPILLLEGVLDQTELQAAIQHHLQIVIHQPHQLELLVQQPQPPHKIWLKLDTGMHRLGFQASEFPAVWSRLTRHYGGEILLMSHFANADDRADPTTHQQHQRFLELTAHLSNPRSMANSAALLAWPTTQQQWVRPGIMLYGTSPFRDSLAAEHGLQAVMTLQSRLIAINHYAAGDAIGYSGISRCPVDMRVGIVAIGYGDGYPRHAKPGTPVLLNGQIAPLIGRVSMDMISIDLRQHPQATIGDVVILWGHGLPAEHIARHADTITYDLFCKITQRVERVYR